jgi:hypothetical protein
MKRESGILVMRTGVLSSLVVCLLLNTLHGPQWAFIASAVVSLGSVIVGLVMSVLAAGHDG